MTDFSRAARTRLLSWCLLGLPLAGLGGCSVFDAKPAAAPVPLVISQPGKSALALTAASNGARVVLDRAQTLVVSLEVAGNQDTDWVLIGLPAGLTVVAGPRFERAVRSPNGDEFSGATVWHLRAGAAGASGETALRFELRRPRSTQAPLQSVAYTVVLQ